MIGVGIALSVLAACCYAIAATLQHQAVHTVAEGVDRLRLTQLPALARRGRWLLGLLALGTGAGLHVVALSLAPLLVVQPIGVLAIGLTTLLAAPSGRAVLDRATVLAVLATAVGLGLFLLFAVPHAHGAATPVVVSGQVLMLAGIAVAALVLAALSAGGWARCLLYATAAGVAYGTVSALTRSLAQQVRLAGLAGLPIEPTALAVLGVLLAVVIGAVCVQQAYAGGRPDTVLACQTVVDPLTGVLFGLVVFHEAIDATPTALLGELAGAALATAGVVVLAHRRPGVHQPSPPIDQEAGHGPSTSDPHRRGHLSAGHQRGGPVRSPVGHRTGGS